MKLHPLHSSLLLLAALGVIGPAAAQAVDTSQWKCETCPYPKGTSGSFDAGVGSVSDASQAFGDYTGLNRKRAHLVLGGEVLHRGPNGYWAEASATELGLDSRRLAGQAGREGQYALRLGYSQIPRNYADGAATPFLGVGGATLTLPAGYPAATSGAMPLATTLSPVRLGLDRQRFEVGGDWFALAPWSVRVDFRRDVRDGTRPLWASFFSTAAQLPAAVDEVSDELEIALRYRGRPWQATLAYRYSQFDNRLDAIAWSNPFTPVVAGAVQGRLATAPGNRAHHLVGSGAWQVMPMLRASGDFAVGRLTQNEAYLASTSNSLLVVPALPAASLDGRVDTFSGSARVVATPLAALRLSASYARDVRENDTAVLAYPQVATDMFLNTGTRSNTPFSFWRDRVKLHADWSGWSRVKLAAGVDYEEVERNYAEVVTTKETTGWASARVQALDNLTLALKISGAERDASSYGVATWFGSTVENPLLRKLNLAERTRSAAHLRADFSPVEKLSLGLTVDHAEDDYDATAVGLQNVRSTSVGGDAAFALSDKTRLSAFAQEERVKSRQAGGETLAAGDWSARLDDRYRVAGFGVRHSAMADKLELGADVALSRVRGLADVRTGVGEPPFAPNYNAVDSAKLFATYKLNDKMAVTASWWYEKRSGADWRYDGIGAGTVPTLLALGQTTPAYTVHVLRVAVRHRF